MKLDGPIEKLYPHSNIVLSRLWKRRDIKILEVELPLVEEKIIMLENLIFSIHLNLQNIAWGTEILMAGANWAPLESFAPAIF
jgi:hypothetical protein